jgi:hypothetical protein
MNNFCTERAVVCLVQPDCTTPPTFAFNRHTYAHTHPHTNAHWHILTPTHTYYTIPFTHVNTGTHTCADVHAHTHTHAQTHTCMRTCIRARIHQYFNACCTVPPPYSIQSRQLLSCVEQCNKRLRSLKQQYLLIIKSNYRFQGKATNKHPQ